MVIALHEGTARSGMKPNAWGGKPRQVGLASGKEQECDAMQCNARYAWCIDVKKMQTFIAALRSKPLRSILIGLLGLGGLGNSGALNSER